MTKAEFLYRLSLIPKTQHHRILSLRQEYVETINLKPGQNFSARWIRKKGRATLIRWVIKDGDIYAHVKMDNVSMTDEEGVIEGHLLINVINTKLNELKRED